MKALVTLALPGKRGAWSDCGWSTRGVRFQSDELLLAEHRHLLGMTLQNVRLFEQVNTVQQQWEYTFDSIGDPILVHDGQGRIREAISGSAICWGVKAVRWLAERDRTFARQEFSLQDLPVL